MSILIDNQFWLQLFGILAAEALFILALAFVFQSVTKSTFWRRTIWQVALLCLPLLLAADGTGFGRGAAIWLAGKPPVERIVSSRIVPMDEQLRSPVTPKIVVKKSTAQKVVHPEPTGAWWPGILWVVGFTFVMTRIVISRVLLLALSRRKNEIKSAILSERVSTIAMRLGICRKILLVQNQTLTSPIAFGVVQPSIGLPINFETTFNPAQQEAMLAHELAHLAAHDPFWYFVADVASAVFWWHPFVWLARRRLHVTSELAADEATTLIENGPCTLAECLVVLGRQLTNPRNYGSLGVTGFRSNLGQRVERLLNLKASTGKPIHGWRLFLTKTAFTVLLGGIVIFTSGWVQNKESQREKTWQSTLQQSWNGSFAAITLAALNEKEPEIAPIALPKTTEKNQPVVKPEMLSLYITYYDAPLTEAFPFNNFKGDAVLFVPSNELQTALSTLANQPHTFDAVGNKFSGMNLRYQGNPTNKENTCIYLTETKNGQTVATGAEMNYASSNAWSFSLVPQKKSNGIDVHIEWLSEFLKGKKANFTMAMDKGAVIHWQSSKNPKRGQFIVLSSFPIPAYEGNQKSGKKETPVQTIPNSEIAETPKLITKTFRLNPNTYLNELESFGLRIGQVDSNSNSRLEDSINIPHVTAPTVSTGATGTNKTSNPNDLLHAYFKAAGVDLSPPKSLFFNDRKGVVMVHASTEDLEIIATAVDALNEAPPQITIEAKFAEIEDSGTNAMGADWFIGNTSNLVQGAVFKTPATVNAAIGSTNLNNDIVANCTGILTDPQFRLVIKALDKRNGVDLLSAPKVTTISGRQAQVSVLDLVSVVSGASNVTKPDGTKTMEYNVQSLPLGPTLDVIPTVLTDGVSIRLTIIATITEFLGYDKPDEFVRKAGTNLNYTLPLPRLRMRQVTTSVTVWDGQTVVLGGIISESVKNTKNKTGGIGSVPLLGKLFRNESTKPVRKNLLIFVTPTMTDPAGNRVHLDDELSNRGSIPPQTAPVEVK